MQSYYGGKPVNPAEQYLAQRINGASPEQLVAILLEGACRFLNQAVTAMRSRDIQTKARMVNKVSAILEELTIGLNHEDGGELVVNLTRIYEWWIRELFEASQKNQPERLEFIGLQMADMRNTWNQLSQPAHVQQSQPAFSAEGLVG